MNTEKIEIHGDDRDEIERKHGAISDEINDMLISFQDDAYKLGLNRGKLIAAAERDELLAVLKKANDLFFLAEGSDHAQMYMKQAENLIKRALAGAA